jgi:hypothetical protein
MTGAARRAVEAEFLRLLRERRPGFDWAIVRPGERGERDTTTAAGEVVGGLARPEDEQAPVEIAAAAEHDSVDAGGENPALLGGREFGPEGAEIGDRREPAGS